jgi:hypothetical protein
MGSCCSIGSTVGHSATHIPVGGHHGHQWCIWKVGWEKQVVAMSRSQTRGKWQGVLVIASAFAVGKTVAVDPQEVG